ncbi:MAG TPA: ElyC/SanA/YdcF family protein [Acidimicrobiales bacterium]|nr:ElyC/SanA/YdcF family protein [Acidimicrobiales bacterium]
MASPAEAPADTAAPPTRPRRRRRWLRRLVLLVVVLMLGSGLVTAATARLFVWPARGVPQHADAIVLFGGRGFRLSKALQLAYSGYAPELVISRGTPGPDVDGVPGDQTERPCAPPIPNVRVTCFDPDPVTTRGEARFIGRMAKERHWRSVIVVSTRPQATRARLRTSRCFSGQISVATSDLMRADWPHEVVYEWGALLKALALQRSC